jgi:hypothetical protein
MNIDMQDTKFLINEPFWEWHGDNRKDIYRALVPISNKKAVKN